MVMPFNINETSFIVTVSASSTYYLLPYVPQHIVFVNSSTSVVYVKAAGSATDPITAPSPSATNGAITNNAGWTEVPVGIPYVVNWSSTFKNAPYLYVVGSGTGNMSVKLTRGQ